MATVLFSTIRNEAPFLLEWIAYHRVIGFDKIVIMSNNCDDGSDVILESLASNTIVRHVPHLPQDGESAQSSAARAANELAVLAEGDWAIWLDADEFLVVNVGQGKIDDLIHAASGKSGVLIPWRIFGDGGQTSFGGRFISSSHSLASRRRFKGNREIKTFYQKSDAVVGFAQIGINRPRIARGSNPGLDTFLSARGETLVKSKINMDWLAGIDFGKTNLIHPDERGYKLAQINHYIVRTPEHFLLKRKRGRGWKAGKEGESNDRHTEKFYKAMNRNDVQDVRILRHETAVGEEIASLRQLPGVKEAEQFALDKVSAQIAMLPRDQLARLHVLGGSSSTTFASVSPTAPEFSLTLPKEAAAAVEAAYSKATCILQYGSGGSTFLGLHSGAEFVMAVESDLNWANNIRERLSTEFSSERFRIHHVDIGGTRSWGRTVDSSGFMRYHLYPASVWDQSWFNHPDVILIDGRFRAACFVTAMLRCVRPTKILFDDYADRPHYHWIEDYFSPVEKHGRLAVFNVLPVSLNAKDLTRLIGCFSDQE